MSFKEVRGVPKNGLQNRDAAEGADKRPKQNNIDWLLFRWSLTVSKPVTQPIRKAGKTAGSCH